MEFTESQIESVVDSCKNWRVKIHGLCKNRWESYSGFL